MRSRVSTPSNCDHTAPTTGTWADANSLESLHWERGRQLASMPVETFFSRDVAVFLCGLRTPKMAPTARMAGAVASWAASGEQDRRRSVAGA
jgi:hypothetical protein